MTRPGARSSPADAPASVRRGRPPTADAGQLADHILDTSWSLLLEDGLDRFSIDRLARAAHVGKATVYARFPTRTALVAAVLARQVAATQSEILTTVGDVPFAARLEQWTAATLRSVLSPRGRAMERLLDWLEAQGDGHCAVRQQVYLSGISRVEDEFAEAMRRGEARFDDIGLSAHFWMEGVIGHARLYSTDPGAAADHDRWARDYTRYFLRGAGVAG